MVGWFGILAAGNTFSHSCAHDCLYKMSNQHRGALQNFGFFHPDRIQGFEDEGTRPDIDALQYGNMLKVEQYGTFQRHVKNS